MTFKPLHFSAHADDRYQTEIPDENEQHGDILQGAFRDSPYESTRKFMLALRWINQNLPKCRPRFILKTQVRVRKGMNFLPFVLAVLATEKHLYVLSLASARSL